LRIDAAMVRAGTGIVALCWVTTGIAASAGTASATAAHTGKAGTSPPSIQLLAEQPSLAGTCGGNAFDVATFINVTAQASADVRVSAPGVGAIEEFTDETGKNIGPYNDLYPTFQILAFGGGLPPNTLLTIAVTTYSGPNLSGSVTFVSTLTFNCTTGAVILAQQPSSSTADVPTLSSLALAATSTLLLLTGVILLRSRRARARNFSR
jgi:hypothetical protein